MNIVLDLIVVLVFFFSIFFGYKKGFIKGLMGLVSGLLALVIAFLLNGPVAGFVDSTFVYPATHAFVEEKITSSVPDGTEDDQLLSALKDAPEELKDFFRQVGFDMDSLSASQDGTPLIEHISRSIAQPVSRLISSVIAFIVLYLVALVMLRIVTVMLDGLFRLPILRIPNKLLGALMGLITGVVTCLVLCSVIQLILPYLVQSENPLFANVTADKTLVFRWFCNVEVFQGLLANVIAG